MSLDRHLPALAITLALWPAVGAAQSLPGRASGPVDLTPAADRGVEVGASSMVVAIFPTIGGQISIPASRRVRVEFAAHALPWLLEDGEDLGLLTQLQVQVPFRAGPPGSRRSLLLGVTNFTFVDHLDSTDEWEFFGSVRPHAGISWQWQRSRHVDMRVDVQGVFTGQTPVFAIPLASFSILWHRDRGWS
jgi:hypothetical protein